MEKTIVENNIIYNISDEIKKNCNIVFEGENNILFFEETPLTFVKSEIIFKGNNSLVYISKSAFPLKLSISIYNNSVIFVDDNISMNNNLQIIASEEKNVFIGKESLISSSVIIRTSDAHRIFSIETMKRINQGKSVFIGDHVWLAARVVLLKNSRIHSGSIIGSDAVLTGKEVMSNSIWGGVPAKCIEKGVFFDKKGTHALGGGNESASEAEIPSEKAIKSYIYEEDENYIDFLDIDNKLFSIKEANEKLDYLLEFKNNTNNKKNRFAKLG